MIKRANINVYGNDYNGYIIIESMEELKNYFEETLNGLQKDSISKLMDRAFTRAKGNLNGHSTDAFVSIAETESETTGCGVLISHTKIFGEIRTSFIKTISRGEKLVINPANGFSHFGFKPSVPHKIEYIPLNEYSTQDIKVFKWNGGAHWYAKIAHIDVVIDGEQKWNAKWVAQQKAEQFLSKMNQKSQSRVG